ncbi:hypothetical protein EDB92DRAFT_2113743, partial [Lactarius akahatsu]
ALPRALELVNALPRLAASDGFALVSLVHARVPAPVLGLICSLSHRLSPSRTFRTRLSPLYLCKPCGIPSAYELTRTRLRTGRITQTRTNARPPARITNQQPRHDVPHGHSPRASPSSSTGAAAGQAHSPRTTRRAQHLHARSTSASAGGGSNGSARVVSVKGTNAVWIQLCIPYPQYIGLYYIAPSCGKVAASHLQVRLRT